MAVRTAEAQRFLGDEEAFAWATASLGEARREGRSRTVALLESVGAELAFDLGANVFPPTGARAAHIGGRGVHKRTRHGASRP